MAMTTPLTIMSAMEEDENDNKMWLVLLVLMERHDGADYEGEKREQHMKEAQEDEHSVVRRLSIRDHCRNTYPWYPCIC